MFVDLELINLYEVTEDIINIVINSKIILFGHIINMLPLKLNHLNWVLDFFTTATNAKGQKCAMNAIKHDI